ncbi:MAG: CBS domain-containing protein [Gammaproteobacteria bacterium]
MKTVKQLLDEKGHEVISIATSDSVFDGIKLMAEKGIGALVVMDGPKLVGVVSERDYARKVILQGRSSHTTSVREIMSAPVVCARPEHTVAECMALVTEKRIRHLPVLQGAELVGMISIGDLVKSIIAEQQFVIEQLESYIAG